MFAEIITIGDEILIGQIIDTNSAFIAQELNKIGISVHQISSVQDEKNHILAAIKEAQSRADIIIMTGGLGPTKDDITKHTLCEYFKDVLVEDTAVLEHIEELFKKYITTAPISDINRQQALVLSKATVLHNAYGTAPGMWVMQSGKAYISMPGVPFEMKELMTTQVIPKISTTFEAPYILHKTIVTYGIGESALAEKISDWEDNLPSFIRLAYLPNMGMVRLRLTAKGPDEQLLTTSIAGVSKTLYQLIGNSIYGEEDGNSLEIVVGKTLTHKGYTLSTAESFTGGKIAHMFTVNPGASAYFKGGVVSYATEAKVKVLGVSNTTISEHSVVSKEVAMVMAKNVQQLFNTDFAIATTGNAGPSKGDSDANIGTIYIGIATPNGVFAEQYMMGNHRERVIQKTAHKALENLQKEILKF